MCAYNILYKGIKRVSGVLNVGGRGILNEGPVSNPVLVFGSFGMLTFFQISAMVIGSLGKGSV